MPKKSKYTLTFVQILDEAHNTAKSHPFNVIMRDFYHKADSSQRPKVYILVWAVNKIFLQVLALTASPPAHTNLIRTKDLISTFESNTDSTIILVNEYKKELMQHISIPVTYVYPIVPSKLETQFLTLVTEMMKKLERGKALEQTEQGEDEVTRGSPAYADWCQSHQNKAELLVFNSSLILFNDPNGIGNAIEHLKENASVGNSVADIYQQLGSATDKEMVQQQIFLNTLNNFKVHSNLMCFLLIFAQSVPEFRGIVFVGTKKGGAAIEAAIKESELSFIKPIVRSLHRFEY